MVRLIVCVSDAGRAAHVGGPVDVTYRTFDIEHSELEMLLRRGRKLSGLDYTDAHISGAEIIPAEDPYVS